MTSATDHDIPDLRLRPQRLIGNRFERADETIRWLTAMQAQDFHGAKWSIALRTGGLSEVEIDTAFNRGEILRTHLLRPTWHFVLPEDIRWLLELTSQRVHTLNGFMYRREGLEPDVLARSNETIARATQGGNHLTREEIGGVFAESGIEVPAFRLGYLIMYAELCGVICSGATRGKNHTYALLEERAPNARRLDREEALAELTRRYFASHGPATIKDFTRWSSLTVADAKLGIELNGKAIERLTSDGRTYWHGEPLGPSSLPSPRVLLVQGYDEYVIAYSDSNGVYAPPAAFAVPRMGSFISVVMLDGMVAGNWRRVVKRREAILEIRMLFPFTEAQMAALESVVVAYRRFIDLPVTISLV